MTDIARLTAALQATYAIERQAGAGGMATVYLARDLKHGRAVAIKVLRPELAASVGSDRFLREIEMAARLQHPHILPVYDSGAADGFLYYVMPFVEGESLRDRLAREGALPIAEAIRLAREAASALEYAHSHGVVHRDIKPENILLFGGHAVVADFGIARALEARGPQSLTGLGMAIGTPAYMSPEQATASEDVDGRSDQYSLACVLYEMLSGKAAFSGPTAQSVMTKSITGPRPRVRMERPQVAESDEAAIMRAFATEPASRFPSMAAFSEALGASLSGTGPALARSRRASWIAAAATAIVAVAGFAFWSRARATSPVIEAAQRIAVMPFRTSGPGVDLLGEGMVDLLSTNLDAVGGISTVEPRTVLQRWKERGSGIDLDGALAVGKDVDASAVLLGSVIATGSAVRLTADLYGSDAAKLATATVNGPADSVLGLVDDLSLALMREVWRSREPIPSLRVAGLTTTSVAAMRAYLQGEQFYRQSIWDSAGAAFSRAIEQDSTFALAQYRLAMTYGWSGNANSRQAAEAGAAAVRFASRLPADERSLVVAYRLFQQGRLEATDSMLRYTAAHPDDADGWYLLGESRFHSRLRVGSSPAQLREPFDRVLALDSSLTPAAIHPLEVTLEERDTVGYRRYMEVLEKSGATGELERFRPAGNIVFGQGALDTAGIAKVFTGIRQDATTSALAGLLSADPERIEASLKRIAEIERLVPATSFMFQFVPQQRGMVIAGLGRLDEARALARTMKGEGRFIIPLTPILAGFAPAGYADSFAALVRSEGVDIPSANVNPFPMYFRSLAALSQGDMATAGPLIDRGLAIDTAQFQRFGGAWVRGLFMAADGWRVILRGDTANGLAKIAAGLDRVGFSGGPPVTSAVRLQRALVLANRAATREEGIRLLRYGFTLDAAFLPITRLALGRALEAGGDRPGAIEAYGEFVRYWAEADSSLQPRVQEAREAIQRLQAAGG